MLRSLGHRQQMVDFEEATSLPNLVTRRRLANCGRGEFSCKDEFRESVNVCTTSDHWAVLHQPHSDPRTGSRSPTLTQHSTGLSRMHALATHEHDADDGHGWRTVQEFNVEVLRHSKSLCRRWRYRRRS